MASRVPYLSSRTSRQAAGSVEARGREWGPWGWGGRGEAAELQSFWWGAGTEEERGIGGKGGLGGVDEAKAKGMA